MQVIHPAPDIRSVEPDLEVPPLRQGPPGPGRRVSQVLQESYGLWGYHTVYLPADWRPGLKYPLLVEYAGNGNYHNAYGDVCTGRPEDCHLGYGLSAGRGYLWVCLPYLNATGTEIALTWWGDPPDYATGPTLDYCEKAVARICQEYGGDEDRVILCGFSRGALACNYLGLHNDRIARLWHAFLPYSHYDGVGRNWPYPDRDRAAALLRLKRLEGRAQFICHEVSANPSAGLASTREYLESTGVQGDFTFQSTGFRNHNDEWMLRPSPARDAARAWLSRIIR